MSEEVADAAVEAQIRHTVCVCKEKSESLYIQLWTSAFMCVSVSVRGRPGVYACELLMERPLISCLTL